MSAQGKSRAFLLFSVERPVTYRAMTESWAEQRPGCLQPFARRPHRVAARWALALEHPHRVLLRCEEGLARRGRPPGPTQPEPEGDTFERLSMPGFDVHGGVD